MAEEIESRMEQIRMKNEELEKKHKEILEDENLAKKIGAVVTKQNSSANEKSAHPYDNLDLDFDVKEEQREHAKNPDFKPKSESSCRKQYLHNFFALACRLLIPSHTHLSRWLLFTIHFLQLCTSSLSLLLYSTLSIPHTQIADRYWERSS
jgi:hypothetical protein